MTGAECNYDRSIPLPFSQHFQATVLLSGGTCVNFDGWSMPLVLLLFRCYNYMVIFTIRGLVVSLIRY